MLRLSLLAKPYKCKRIEQNSLTMLHNHKALSVRNRYLINTYFKLTKNKILALPVNLPKKTKSPKQIRGFKHKN